MTRIAITGANGYLASLVQTYNAGTFDFIRVSRSDVDYADLNGLRSYFEALDFDILFHTAANATTADCENDPAGTHRVNCEAAIGLGAHLPRARQAHDLHLDRADLQREARARTLLRIG